MKVNENLKNKVRIIEKKKEIFVIYLKKKKTSHILAVMYPRPMNMVANFSLG